MSHLKHFAGETLTVSRRRLLQSGLALVAAGEWSSAGRIMARAADGESTVRADQLVVGKDRRLLVHNPSPTGFEIETPLEILRDESITSLDKLFVRNNQQPSWSATLESPPAGPWELEIGGLLEFPRRIKLEELKSLPRDEHELVLQCSGNGRAMFHEAAPVQGAPWKHGAMGNVRFKGVSLKTVFDKLDVRPHTAAKFITAEGADMPGKPGAADFEHSLPLGETLARAILALEVNGRALPAVHGGPLRLVMPGYYGTMHVKWLARLRLESQETVNHHQAKRYRTPREPIKPGSDFKYELENSDPNWRMRIKSVIFAPAHDAALTDGRVIVRGVAWNDGTSLIDAVEISDDGGKSWRRAELERSGRYAWQRWQLPLTLTKGKHALVSRAVDTLGNTQPLDGAIDWNPAGYGWHGADRVTVEVKA